MDGVRSVYLVGPPVGLSVCIQTATRSPLLLPTNPCGHKSEGKTSRSYLSGERVAQQKNIKRAGKSRVF